MTLGGRGEEVVEVGYEQTEVKASERMARHYR